MEAKPVQYREASGIGNVFLAAVDGTSVRRREPEENNNVSLCVELEDVEQVAARELGATSVETTLRLLLHTRCAILLCHDLIDTLASTGDKTAMRLRHLMRQAMIDVRAEAQGLSPEQKDQLRDELGWNDEGPQI